MADCDCHVIYEPVEVWVKPLLSTGAEDPAASWYESTAIIDWDASPNIETGKETILRCGGVIKNVMTENDELKSVTLKVTTCCEDGEFEYIINGSTGTRTYDASSPPCCTGYEEPTLAEQANSVPFELKLYLKEVSGSSVVGYKEIHFWQCLPTFLSEGGVQQDYTTPSYTISCVENANYGTAKPVRSWAMLAAIP